MNEYKMYVFSAGQIPSLERSAFHSVPSNHASRTIKPPSSRNNHRKESQRHSQSNSDDSGKNPQVSQLNFINLRSTEYIGVDFGGHLLPLQYFRLPTQYF